NARALGVRVVGVTSVAYASQTTSRHVSGTFLKDHCDVVLDSKIAVGDAELTHDRVPAPFAPASTVVTTALLQAVMATAAAGLAPPAPAAPAAPAARPQAVRATAAAGRAARGIEPPLRRSGNVDGGHEWNGRVFEEYGERIFYRH